MRQARALTTRYAAGCGTAALMWLVSAVVPAPGRFAIWALALIVDVLTPLLTTRHLVNVPHDGAHLPERYGLFSIILLGESMVAVMTGWADRNTGARARRHPPFSGMTLVFAVWWWISTASMRGCRRGDAFEQRRGPVSHLELRAPASLPGNRCRRRRRRTLHCTTATRGARASHPKR